MLDPAGPGLILNRSRRFYDEDDYEEERCHYQKPERKRSEVKKVTPKIEMTTDDLWFRLIKIYQNKPKVRQMLIEAFLEANKGSDV